MSSTARSDQAATIAARFEFDRINLASISSDDHDRAMMRSLQRLHRHIRFGAPIFVVSGLPRSGTSMMMKMLRAGGMPLAVDEKRTADDSNPEGYFELEQVKTLDKGQDHPWLRSCRGRAVKIISFLLPHLPDDLNYRVIFMQRDLREVIASQERMLRQRGEPAGTDAAKLTEQFREHLGRIERLLRNEACFDAIDVSYNRALADPQSEARRVQQFIGPRLDLRAMVDAVNPALYRNREQTLP
jgi:hypothetical protein